MKTCCNIFSLLILIQFSAAAQTTQDISSGAARNIFDILRTIPGIEISSGTSIKDQPKVYIRDARNMKGKIPAIFVLDKAIYEGDITMINPIDVADITVLKDAASAAAYGARGFGGVVQITTKSGNASVPPAVNTFNKSAYQYFITKNIDLRVIGKDGKTLTTGVISKETDSSIIIRKKEILKKNIEKVEIIPQ
jgi:TonB-dependent SusC/RagA subfamily outer membrane receptor